MATRYHDPAVGDSTALYERGLFLSDQRHGEAMTFNANVTCEELSVAAWPQVL
jgi:hypothetical protein